MPPVLQMTWLRLLHYWRPRPVERDLRPLWEETGADLHLPDCLRGRVPLAATVLRASHDFYRGPSIWMLTKTKPKKCFFFCSNGYLNHFFIYVYVHSVDM